MFLLKNASRECAFIVVFEHWNGFLHNDGAMVELFVHKMHGAAGNLYAVGESLLLRLQSGKRRKQRWMNI